MRRSPRHLVPVVAVLLTMAVALTGCGTTAKKKVAAGPDQAVLSCRAQWGDLDRSYAGRDQSTMDSDLAARWNNLLATLDYYKTSATAEDCPQGLVNQQAAITDLEDFSAKLRAWDMPYQVEAVGQSVSLYLESPLPVLRKRKGHPRPKPPSKKVVRQAYQDLEGNAPLTLAALAAGWAEANQVDLDPAAEAKAIRDLSFLATQNARFQLCLISLQVIHRAETATETAIS